MIGNKIRVRKAARQIVAFFKKEGKIFTQAEYLKQRPQPVLGSTIKSIFGSYESMLTYIKASPAWDEIKDLDVKPVKVAKPAPVLKSTKAPAKPIPAKKPVAAKPAKVKVEK
jgi:hypothetical protein